MKYTIQQQFIRLNDQIWVTKLNEEDGKVVRNVDYEKLSIVLLSEVQKLRREVDNLKNNN